MAYTYSKISSVTVGSGGSSSINFISIPQNYDDLVLKISARSASNSNWVLIGINGTSDTTVTLRHVLNFSGSIFGQAYSSFRSPVVGSTLTSNTFSNGEIYFPKYSTYGFKTITGDGVQESNSVNCEIQMAVFSWSNTAPINQLALTIDGGGDFTQYSTATLYGIKAEV